MKEISLKELLESGAHFGHQTTRWNPKMKPYIFTARDGIHIFDLVKTKVGLEAASAFAKATASQGGRIIFIGTKRQSQDIIREAAKKVGMPYITERWIGGLITNWEQLKKRLNHLADLKTGKAENRFKDRAKKENLLIDREIIKMERIFGGVADLKEIPAAVFVTDARKDTAVLKEARNRGVATIAIVDTNVDPDNVDFVIPANDDAIKSIQLIVDYITEVIKEGQNQFKVQSLDSARDKSEKLKVSEEKVEPEGGSEEKEEGTEKRKTKGVGRKTSAKSAKPAKKGIKEEK